MPLRTKMTGNLRLGCAMPPVTYRIIEDRNPGARVKTQGWMIWRAVKRDLRRKQ